MTVSWTSWNPRRLNSPIIDNESNIVQLSQQTEWENFQVHWANWSELVVCPYFASQDLELILSRNRGRDVSLTKEVILRLLRGTGLYSLAKHVWDAHGCTTSHQMSITSDSSSNLLRAQQSKVPSANKAVMRVSHDEPTSIMISVTCSLDKNLDHLWHLVSPMWGSVIVAFSKTTGTRQHAIPLTHPRNTSARKGGHRGRQVATLGRLLRLVVSLSIKFHGALMKRWTNWWILVHRQWIAWRFNVLTIHWCKILSIYCNTLFHLVDCPTCDMCLYSKTWLSILKQYCLNICNEPWPWLGVPVAAAMGNVMSMAPRPAVVEWTCIHMIYKYIIYIYIKKDTRCHHYLSKPWQD